MTLAAYAMVYDPETGDVDAPPNEAAEGLQLAYVDGQGNVMGGRADASPKPPLPGVSTVLVMVEADDATHAAMQADPRWLWLEDV